jgi:DNA-binding transcriptional LysR family regulator
MNRQFDDVMLGSIELFCLAAEKSSFTQAAVLVGLSPAAVSRSIARLESRLGVRLFIRTTRHIRLSDAGQAYFEKCRQALDQFAEAEREVAGQQIVPAGTLRISVPTPYGHYRILPLLPLFRRRYPTVNIEIHLSNRNIDFSTEGYDLAIRARCPPDSGLIARKLEDAELIVVAAPSYLQSTGVPMTLEDLERHECIQFVLPSSGQANPWLFRDNSKDVDIIGHGGYSCSDDILGGVTLARHGAGLLQTYRYIVENDLKNGNLQEVLQPFSGRSRPFSLIYPKNQHIPLRVRVFIDFLINCAENGYKYN